MKNIKNSYIALGVAALFSVVYLMATYGTALLATPFASVDLKGPSAVDADGEFTAIADSDSRRVLIANADGQLTGVVNCNTLDSPFESVTDVCVSDGMVYVAGLKNAPDSSLVLEERVAAYDKGGNFHGTLFSLAGQESAIASIKALDAAPDGFVVSYAQVGESSGRELNASVSFTLVDPNETRELAKGESGNWLVYDACYSHEADEYAYLSSRGILNDGERAENEGYPDRVFTSIDLDDAGTLFACDDMSGSLCIADGDGVRELVEGNGYNAVHANSEVVVVCSESENLVRICNHEGVVTGEFTSITPSIGYMLRMSLVWICAIYLVVLVVVLAARRAYALIASGHTEGAGPLLASVAVIVVIGLAVGSLTSASQQASIETRANEINMCADYLDMTTSEISKAMEACNNRNLYKGNAGEFDSVAESYIAVVARAAGIVDAAGRNNIGMYCAVYGRDGHGIFNLYDSMFDRVLGVSVSDASAGGALKRAFDDPGASLDSVIEGHSLRDETRFRLVRIPASDGTGVAGVIEIGCHIRSFESGLNAQTAQRIMALLVMTLVVFLTYTELRECGRCLFSYRRLQDKRADDAIAVLTRPFTFAITLLSSIDSVMTVLIARDLLNSSGLGENGALLALPAIMLGIGLVTGQALYGLLGSRVGVRSLMMGGAIVMMLCAGFTGAAVVLGEYWMYCVAKLALSIPSGMLYTMGYSLPRIAKSDETRAAAAGGVKRTDTSAAALGTVLGGYAAQTLGNAWVYAIVGLACLPAMLMAMGLVSRGMRPPERGHDAHGTVVAFVKTPVAIAIALLVVLPATVAAGYASFLFPLFSIDLGLSKADINNIFVMGQLVVFVCISGIDSLEERFGKWRITTAAIATLGVVFLLFSLNTTIAWSILVIALVALLGKSSDGWKAMWLHAAGEADVPVGRATSAMFAARSLAQVAQPFILGSLVAGTDSVAVIVIGLICVVCAGLFFSITRRSVVRTV